MSNRNKNGSWNFKNKYGYKKPFSNLAAAILEYAKRDNDVRFFKSNWCECLRMMCRLDSKMYDQKNTDYLEIY